MGMEERRSTPSTGEQQVIIVNNIDNANLCQGQYWCDDVIYYLLFLTEAFFFGEASASVAAFTGLAFFDGLDLPKDPLNIFPFLVLISPRPIVIVF